MAPLTVEVRQPPDAAAAAGSPDPEQVPLLSRLPTVLQGTEFAWSLGLVGEDHAAKLGLLAGDLRRPASAAGDGKRITSGFSYLGAEPADAWTKACRDHLYPVMRQSIESFDRRWDSVRPGLAGRPYHYVSLGPGDGQKDAVILHDLRRDNPALCYVPVDMSAELLRLGVCATTRQLRLARGRTLPIQLDFSLRHNLAELRRLLDGLFGEQPVLFALLGNTLANFEDDAGVLRMLTGQLLRPQDRFVLEVATTRGLDESLAQEAAAEYGRSRTFREFVTSALAQYTDLHIDMDNVLCHGLVEGDRALLVKVIYQNRAGPETRITLPDRTDVAFAPQDTIRLFTSRKYTPAGIGALLSASAVQELHGTHSDLGPDSGLRFGMDLLVLAAGGPAGQPDRTVADDIWLR